MSNPSNERIIHFTLPLSLSLLLAAVALILSGGERIQVTRMLAVRPVEETPLLAVYLSSRAGVSDALAMTGAEPEEMKKLLSDLASRVSAKAEDGVAVLSLDLSSSEAEQGKLTAAFVKAAMKYIDGCKERACKEREHAVLGLESARGKAEAKVKALRSKLTALLLKLPGEFDSHYLPTGLYMQEAGQLTTRIERLKAGMAAQAVSMDAGRMVPADYAAKRLSLQQEKEQLSQSLGPLHPKMVRLAKELEKINNEAARFPYRDEGIIPAALDAESSKSAGKELASLQNRRDMLLARAKDVRGAAAVVNDLVIRLIDAEGAFMKATAASTGAEANRTFSVEEIGERWARVQDNTGLYQAFGLVAAGFFIGLILARGGTSRRQAAARTPGSSVTGIAENARVEKACGEFSRAARLPLRAGNARLRAGNAQLRPEVSMAVTSPTLEGRW